MCSQHTVIRGCGSFEAIFEREKCERIAGELRECRQSIRSDEMFGISMKQVRTDVVVCRSIGAMRQELRVVERISFSWLIVDYSVTH